MKMEARILLKLVSTCNTTWYHNTKAEGPFAASSMDLISMHKYKAE
jgi:hypothetical protein